MQHSQDRSGEHVGDYRLQRQVGAGSFGEVYQAEDRRSHHLVAVKLLKTSLTRREDLKAFLNEARAFRLHHPHIVPLLDFGLSEHDLPFLVMEYVAGGTLRDHYPKGSQVPLDVVVDLTGQLASALQYAHDQHLVHRDVKPENMLCRTDGTVLLSDFGIASVAPASSSVSLYQGVGGTLSYMAPEQLQGKPRPQSDQYALAVAVYEWLAGMRPFQGTALELISQHLHMPPPRLLDRVPPLPAAVEQIVFKALAKQPEDRFACVQDFATALQTACQPTILLPPAPTPLPSILSSPSPKNMLSTLFPSSPTATAPWSQSATGRPVQEPSAEVSFSRRSSVPPLSSPGGGSIAPPLLPTPPLSAHRWRHPRSVFVLLLCFVLVVGASGGAIWGVKRYQAQQRTSSLTATTTAALLATTTATTKACQAATANGTQFGFDTANTHWNRCEQRINKTNVTRLSVLWYYTEPYGFGDPTVANGKVYIASTDSKLFAFDAACRRACQPLWSSIVDSAGNLSDPFVANGIVYISSDRYPLSAVSKLFAFDATCQSTCQPLWSYQIAGYVGDPTVADGVVYISSATGKLFAFDATCRNACQPLWSYQIDTSGSVTFPAPLPAVADGIVYIQSNNGKLSAFDASCRSTCQPLWSHQIEGGIGKPTVANGVVYVGGDSLYAFDATCRRACQPLWSYQTKGGFSSLSVANGIVYIDSGDSLYAFDAACRRVCQPLWSYQTADSVFSPPIIANNVIYVSSDDSRLYAFDATCRRACQPLWSYQTASHSSTLPAIANSVIYFSAGSILYAFGLSA